MTTLDAWARAHAATIQVQPGSLWSAMDGHAAPAPDSFLPIDHVLVGTEPVLSLSGGSTGAAFAVAAVAWCTSARRGPLLAAGGHEVQVRLWDLASGQPIRAFGPASAENMSIAVTSAGTGRLLVAVGTTNGVVQIWDGETGDLVDSLDIHYYVDSLAWIASGDDRALLGIGATR